MTLYNGPRFCDILDNAHNLPLHLAVELGVPVTLLVCGTVLWTVWRARPWADTDPRRQLAWGVLAVIGLHSLLEYPLWYGPFQMAFGISLGLLSSSRLAPTTRHTQGAFPAGWKAGAERNAPLLLAIVILAGVAGAAWDYHRMRQIYLPSDERMTAYREDTLTRVRAAWLFRDQVRFAELTLTPLTPDNAAWTLATAITLLRFSPEPRVIEKVIESAVLLGQNDLALQHLVRYQGAFPKDHAQWAQALTPTPILTGPGG
jgi:Virulence factor membrane-bound polymerase, C-terminal